MIEGGAYDEGGSARENDALQLYELFGNGFKGSG